MRRIAAVLFSLVLIVTMAATGFAASNVRVLFDEQEVQFDANPFIEDGRTLVPVRALAERLGFSVNWTEGEQKITLTRGDRTILLWIGSTKVVVNGKEGTVDVAPKQVNNRTFVPVRFVAEQLGAHVAWDGNQQAAVVTSGKSLLLKLNKQQTPADQKLTGDLQVQVEMGGMEKGKGGSITLKMPVHMDMQVYHNNILGHVTLQMPAIMGSSADNELGFDIAVKDGKLYGRESTFGDWQQINDFDMSKGLTDAAALLGKSGLGDLAKLQADFMQDAVVTVGGQEELDGVRVVRLDVDLSKLKFSEFLDKLFASLPLPTGDKPDLKLMVDRYVLQLWINPDTQFTHKTTLDMAMRMSLNVGGDTMTMNMAINGEMRAKAVSEPIKFPDFSAPVFTPEQLQAAKLYWDTVEQKLLNGTCETTAADINDLWKAKQYTAGHDAAVKAAACFAQERQLVAALTPPQEFTEGHTALRGGLETSEKAYTTVAGAFELAAKGDLTTAGARKAEGDKLVDKGMQETMHANSLLFRGASRYHLFK